MNYLITGYNGFLGKAFQEYFLNNILQSYDSVTFVDKVYGGWIPAPSGINYTTIKMLTVDLSTLTDQEWANLIRYGDLEPNTIYGWNGLRSIFTPGNSTVIYHFASTVGVDTVISDPSTMVTDMVMNTKLIKALQDYAPANDVSGTYELYYTSSSEVYGERSILKEENDILLKTPENNPRGTYAAQKYATEHLILNGLTNPSVLVKKVFRLFSVTGEGQSTDFVLPKMVQNALNGDPITVYGDGSQSRCFMHVDDCIQAIVQSADSPYDLINIGNPWNYVTMHQLAWIIKKKLASSSEIVYEDGPIGEKSRVPQVERMVDYFKPGIKLDEIIERVANYLQPDSIPNPISNLNLSWVDTDPNDYGDAQIEITLTGEAEPQTTIEIMWATGEYNFVDVQADGTWSSSYVEIKPLDLPSEETIIVTAKLDNNIYDQKVVQLNITI